MPDEYCAEEGAYVTPATDECAECERYRKRLAQTTQELGRMKEYAFELLTKLKAYTDVEVEDWDGSP